MSSRMIWLEISLATGLVTVLLLAALILIASPACASKKATREITPASGLSRVNFYITRHGFHLYDSTGLVNVRDVELIVEYWLMLVPGAREKLSQSTVLIHFQPHRPVYPDPSGKWLNVLGLITPIAGGFYEIRVQLTACIDHSVLSHELVHLSNSLLENGTDPEHKNKELWGKNGLVDRLAEGAKEICRHADSGPRH